MNTLYRCIVWCLHFVGVHIAVSRPKFQEQITPIPSYKYNKEEQSWQESTDAAPALQKVRIATHNVLKDGNHWFFEFFLRSNERFTHEMHVLKQINAEVIALNEVTPTFLKMLLSQDWVRNEYYVSDVLKNDNETENDSVFRKGVPMGNVIISKIPIKALSMFRFSSSVTCKRHAIIATFDQLTVCSIHLSAYKKLHQRRADQLVELTKYLPSSNTVILGDFNLQVDAENVSITNCGYYDLWQPSDSDPLQCTGFTWDSNTNVMLKTLIPFFKRRMRLDRIAMSNVSDWKSDQVSLFADKAIAKDSYLFCSDHYGLVTTLVL
jgi:endonuclease/exonuclease/phosphatase family metal-dependent hydrolase